MQPGFLQGIFLSNSPYLSILVPCFNEQATIFDLLEAIGKQSYPMDRLETVIADGGSTDASLAEIERFRLANPACRVVVVQNEKRIIPAGLNVAIRASQGEILLRLDGHSSPAPGYLEACVRLLEEGKGDMVGGGLDVVPRSQSWSARSIAAAVSHPAGVGDSHFRFSDQAQEVDTIAFCAFRKSWVDRIGYYDETLLANEDYEFNSRLRRAGGRIWLDPKLRSKYYPPASYSGLRRQYWRYGFWKAKMAWRFPETLRWRQILPPLAFLAGTILFMLGFLFSGFWNTLIVVVSLYIVVLGLVSIQQAWNRRDPILVGGIPLAILIMHLNWAMAFVTSWMGSMLESCCASKSPDTGVSR